MYSDYMNSKRTKYLVYIIIFLTGIIVGGKILFNQDDKPLATLTAFSKPLETHKEVINLQDSFSRVAEMAKPAVVNINTVQVIKQEIPRYEFFFGDPFEDFFKDFGSPFENKSPSKPEQKYRSYKQSGTGTGFIIDENGYILTNNHVVRDAEKIEVTISDGDKDTKFEGKVVGKDPQTDIAVIKIDSKNKLPFIKLGDSDSIKVGDWVIAIGSPFGLEQTVTAGIISAKRQSLAIEGARFDNMIQTDAAINRGNSGGPLLNIYGEVIGVNTAIYTPTGVFAGIGFAIPINRVNEILDDLIKEGKVVRGWLGIEIRPVDKAISKQFSLPDEEGVLVNNFMPDSPAEKGGMQRGDVIVSLNGEKVKDVISLQKMVADIAPGMKVTVDIIRAGKPKALKIVLGEKPATFHATVDNGKVEEDDNKKSSDTWIGMTVENLTPAIARELDINPDEEGIIIVDIESGSEAEEAGLASGDILKSINRQNVKNIESFVKVTKNIRLKDGIVFDINRRGRLIYITYYQDK